MLSLSKELKRWAVEELELPTHKLPDDGYLKALCVGPGASIWKYITQHVYNDRHIRVIRGNLQWYNSLHDKELKELNHQKGDARKLELQREIDTLQTELQQLDSKLNRAEEQFLSEEHAVDRNWEMILESRRRELLLDSFKQKCSEDRQLLIEDTSKIETQRRFLEELSKKAEVKLAFSESDQESVADPLVLKDVRGLCNERVLFLRDLMEDQLNSNPSSEFARDQTHSVMHYWLSAVEDVFRNHPPNHVLSALQALTFRQQAALDEKILKLNQQPDLSSLGFQTETVLASQEEELPPVRSLLQSAWEELQESDIELAQTRHRCGKLKAELAALLKNSEMAEESLSNGRCVMELEMERVKHVAVRDSVKEQCGHLQLQGQQTQEAVKSLDARWKEVAEYRQLVDKRQDQIRSLIRVNSSLKTEITRHNVEVGRFVQEQLAPQFSHVVKVSGQVRNSVSQWSKLFSGVNLAALDYRVLSGGEKKATSQLSINRLKSPAFHKLCESLSFPLYMAPEELCSQAVAQQLDLRHLRQLLQLLSESTADLQSQTEQLPCPDQQALLERVKTIDDEVLKNLLPSAREVTQRCAKGLLYTEQVKTAITHWWEQPAQFALPEMQREEQTFQQWLQRWKLATKKA